MIWLQQDIFCFLPESRLTHIHCRSVAWSREGVGPQIGLETFFFCSLNWTNIGSYWPGCLIRFGEWRHSFGEIGQRLVVAAARQHGMPQDAGAGSRLELELILELELECRQIHFLDRVSVIGCAIWGCSMCQSFINTLFHRYRYFAEIPY